MLVFLAGFAWASVPVINPDDLVPTPQQRKATHLITRFISQYHFKKTPLDDDLSQAVFARYLEKLDPNRSYFLADDIQRISVYKLYLDDLLRT